MYIYTITFNETIKVEKARQGLLLFLEIFYDSTKAMVCPISVDKNSEILYFSDGVNSPKHTLIESTLDLNEETMSNFATIVNKMLKKNIIQKVKLSYKKQQQQWS